MSRRSLLAACGSFAAALVLAALPVCAQTATEASSQPAPETATAAPPTAPPIVEIDPLVAQVRQQLAGSLRGEIAAADRAAVVAFYAYRASLIWVLSAYLFHGACATRDGRDRQGR